MSDLDRPKTLRVREEDDERLAPGNTISDSTTGSKEVTPSNDSSEKKIGKDEIFSDFNDSGEMTFYNEDGTEKTLSPEQKNELKAELVNIRAGRAPSAGMPKIS